ncbi:MAG: tetratricopeptide repeat protein, partial [Bacteroidales bacterium]|nr:tetratricopeptide repeat protein [Bacteroidales bacterium]
MDTSFTINNTDKVDNPNRKQVISQRLISFSNEFTKTIIILMVFLFLPLISGSQESIPDLLRKYNSHEHDTIRINALLDIGMVYEKNNNPDSAKLYFKEAEKFSLKSLTNTKQKREEIEELQLLSCRSQRYLALLYRNTGNQNESIETFKKVIQRYETLLKSIRKSRLDYTKSELSKTYNNLGTAYLSVGNYLASIESHNKSHELKLEIGDIKGAGISLVNIGNVHFYQGNLDEANKSYFEALDVLNKTNEYKEISTTQTSIGNVY